MKRAQTVFEHGLVYLPDIRVLISASNSQFNVVN
jgi:hypothetical protein